MKKKNLAEIINKINTIQFKQKFDMAVAIGRGGILPAYFVSQKQGLDFEILWLRYRNDKHEIIFEQPRLMKPIDFPYQDKNILLIDDVSRTGQTFRAAKEYLKKARIIRTFVINGQADYYLYNQACFHFL